MVNSVTFYGFLRDWRIQNPVDNLHYSLEIYSLMVTKTANKMVTLCEYNKKQKSF